MMKKGQKVLVGMSGGVDSSVAALLLQKEGYGVEGIFIDFVGSEKSERDFQKAQEVAKKLNIPIHKIEAQKLFKEKIIDKFVEDYRKGVTPNPCVMCNPQMKFKILLEESDKRGINFVSTGHYACVRELRIKNEESKAKESHQPSAISHQLFVARDKGKDQSYFLYRLTQEQLSRIIFPLGDYLKNEVREIAKKNGFKIKNEEESQDVCFIADNDFNKFIGDKIIANQGEIVDNSGKVLGMHKGLYFYTIGQRKGINLGGDGPYYVIKKDLKNNQLVVSNNTGDLERIDFKMDKTNWVSPDINFPLRAKVKIRYRAKEEYAIISKGKDGLYKVKFEKSQKSITNGQSAVCYSDDNEVWGGGIII
ncbi:MAG: tRNA 2-thiouridine(34) synthase MnmA [Parcubacteria group bacterium]|jgi:tRNA-specific 2-thiouridylase